MSWERFHYICRRCHRLLEANEGGDDPIGKAKSDSSGELYGALPPADSIASRILAQLQRRSNAADLAKLTYLYGNLRLVEPAMESAKLKRASAYIILILAVFLTVTAIYAIYVLPTFQAAFSDLGLPQAYEGVSIVGPVYLLVIIALLASAYWYRFLLWRVVRHRAPMMHGVTFKILPRKIKRAYGRLISTLWYPLEDASNPDDPVVLHLARVENEQGNLLYEMQQLIETQSRALQRAAEWVSTLVMVVVGILVIYAVWTLLVRLYVPIFQMGNVI